MNLVIVGGTRKPIETLRYLRLLRDSNGASEKLVKVVFGRGVRTQVAFADLTHVNSLFVIQKLTTLTMDYAREWPGVFIERALTPGEEVGDLVWSVTWEDLFDRCYVELSRAATEEGYDPAKLPFMGFDFKLANGVAQLLWNTFDGVKELLQDYTLFRQDALMGTPRCGMCAHFETKPDDIGACEFHAFLTGEERGCKRFQPAAEGASTAP